MVKKNWSVLKGSFTCDCYILPTIYFSCTGLYNEVLISWFKFYIGIRWWLKDEID